MGILIGGGEDCVNKELIWFRSDSEEKNKKGLIMKMKGKEEEKKKE